MSKKNSAIHHRDNLSKKVVKSVNKGNKWLVISEIMTKFERNLIERVVERKKMSKTSKEKKEKKK